jgi:flagellar basal-body rod protein FlgB
MYSTLDGMGRVNLMMDLITQKQRALGSNLANVDTPGYLRRDIDFADYLGTLGNPIETKLSQKLGPSAVIEEKMKEEIDPAKELFELQQNSLLYTMATRRMSNIITEMKTVINVGK